MTRSTIRSGAALLAAACLGAALTGCGGGHDDARPQSDTTTAATEAVALPPTLDKSWTTPVADGATPTSIGDLDGARTAFSDHVEVTRDYDGLDAVDLDTGRRLWNLVAPTTRLRGADFCAISPTISSTGYVAVLIRSHGHPCTTAGAVDVRTGKLAWTHETKRRSSYDEGRSVDVTAHAVVAKVFCDEVDRFRLSDGKPLPIIDPADRKCANDAAVRDDVLATLHDPETAQTPDDHGTGFIPPSDEPGAFELWDADTGERRWSRPLTTTRGAAVVQVLATKPLIVTYEEHGLFASRIVRSGGRPGPYVGRTLGYNQTTTVFGQGDGVIVLGYPKSPYPGLAFGYSTRTGRELWHVDLAAPAGASGTGSFDASLPGGASVVGDRLILARPVLEPTRPEDASGVGYPTSAVWVTSVALQDPSDVQTLGRTPGSLAVLRGDLLLTRNTEGSQLTRVVLPMTGTDRTYAYPTTTQLGTTDSGLTSTDLTTSDTALACNTVSAATLALIGINRDGVPPPSDCDWLAGDTLDEREVRVTVTPAVPEYDPSADEPGSPSPSSNSSTLDPAERAARHLANQDLHQDAGRGPIVEVADLGDQAWIRSPGSEDSAYSARVVVRYRNAVVQVDAHQYDDLFYLDHLMPPDAVENTALSAAADVVSSLGGTVDLDTLTGPAPASLEAPFPCRVLTRTAADLVPGAPGRDLSSDASRQRSCEWDTSEDADGDGDYTGATLDAASYVVPASITGLDPAANALRFAKDEVGASRPMHIAGLKGTTYRYVDADRGDDTHDSGPYHDVQLVNVRGNVITAVDYVVWTQPPSIDAMTDSVAGAVRTLAAASRRH